MGETHSHMSLSIISLGSLPLRLLTLEVWFRMVPNLLSCQRVFSSLPVDLCVIQFVVARFTATSASVEYKCIGCTGCWDRGVLVVAVVIGEEEAVWYEGFGTGYSLIFSRIHWWKRTGYGRLVGRTDGRTHPSLPPCPFVHVQLGKKAYISV